MFCFLWYCLNLKFEMSESSRIAEGNGKIIAENAILLPLMEDVDSVTHYVKAVAGVVGSRHILGVYKEKDHIKIYLDNRNYVNNIINANVSVLGHQINVDYAVPPGIKVCLSNLDPGIPDIEIKNLLQQYGSVESRIFREKISADLEYAHIENGVRFTYMKLNENNIPSTLKWMFHGIAYEFNICIINPAKIVMFDQYKCCESVEVASRRSSIADPRNVNNDDQTLKIGSTSNGQIQNNATSVSLSSNVNRDIPTLFRQNSSSVQSYRGRRGRFYSYRRGIRGIRRNWRKRFPPYVLTKRLGRGAHKSNYRSNNNDDEEKSSNEESLSDEENFGSDSSSFPLSGRELGRFLTDVKHKRNEQIVEVARNYLESENFSLQLENLKRQLKAAFERSNKPNLRNRINRVLHHLENVEISS